MRQAYKTENRLLTLPAAVAVEVMRLIAGWHLEQTPPRNSVEVRHNGDVYQVGYTEDLQSINLFVEPMRFRRETLELGLRHKRDELSAVPPLPANPSPEEIEQFIQSEKDAAARASEVAAEIEEMQSELQGIPNSVKMTLHKEEAMSDLYTIGTYFYRPEDNMEEPKPSSTNTNTPTESESNEPSTPAKESPAPSPKTVAATKGSSPSPRQSSTTKRKK